ncbi:MAG: hypothetical protein IJB86_06315 [Clostridia bacterium]|nr:hypothetical protein [Clostridia bacterium]
MKKILAILLAILTVFSFATVSVAAEETTETEEVFTGTLYKYADGLPRINANTEGEVIILQAGDRIQFEAITSKSKTVEVIYYPDVVSIAEKSILNPIWSQKATDEKYAEIKTYATSPMKYKSFVSSNDFVKGEVVYADIIGIGDDAVAKDGAGEIRAEAAPIDYALSGAKFVGWALYKYSSWKATNTTKVTIEVYAVWDRDAGEADDGGEDEGPVVDPNASPIKQALDKVIYYLDIAAGFIKAIPQALNSVISLFFSTGFKNWLYGLFGIEVEG